MGNMQKWSPFVLRIGISLVMIWFATQQFSNPSSWISYLPTWTQNLPISQIGFIYLNGWFEITFGLLMLVGFYTRIVALFLGLHLLGIAFSVGYNPTGVRDFGLSIALISIFLYGKSIWSVDQYLEKKNAIK